MVCIFVDGLRLCINPKTLPIRITGRIRQAKKSAETGNWIYGVEFTQINADDSRKLSELYQSALVERIRRRLPPADVTTANPLDCFATLPKWTFSRLQS